MEKQDLETSTVLKKGKYGFYKSINKIQSVYGEDKNTENKPPVLTPPKNSVSFSAFEPASETNDYFHPEKMVEFIEGLIPKSVKPYWSTGIGKEGFGSVEDTTQGMSDQMDGTTGAVQNETKQLYNQLREIWTQIQDDVNTIGDNNSRQSDKLKAFVHLIRDFILLFYTAISVFNVNTHPNFIDIAGETLTKMFVDTDTGGLTDPEQSRLAIYYFTMIAYASVFIFVAYVATENWYYFLFYEFGEDIMTEVYDKDGNPQLDKDGNPLKKEWSLEVWWSYYEKTRPNLFGLFHALFYVVTAIDSMLRRIRENTKGLDNYSPVFHIILFLVIYYWFNYWATITSSSALDIIFMIVMGFAVLRVCVFSYGSFSFAPASTYYPPSLFSLVITIIKALVLWTIDYSLMSIGKMAVYAYIMFMSFGIISFSETKRKNRGMIGRFFDTVLEMKEYLLLNSDINSKSATGWLSFSYWAHFFEGSWLSIGILLVFLSMLSAMISETKNISSFAPLYYFVFIFIGGSIVKMIFNNIKSMIIPQTAPVVPVSLDQQRDNLKNNIFLTPLTQGPNFSPKTETQYKTGIVDGANLFVDSFGNTIKNTLETGKDLINGNTSIKQNAEEVGKKIFNEIKPFEPDTVKNIFNKLISRSPAPAPPLVS